MKTGMLNGATPWAKRADHKIQTGKNVMVKLSVKTKVYQVERLVIAVAIVMILDTQGSSVKPKSLAPMELGDVALLAVLTADAKNLVEMTCGKMS